MIGLNRRSSSSMPASGSETDTGLPRSVGVGVATTCVGPGVPGGGVPRVPGATATIGVGVAGGSGGLGVSSIAGFARVGVGAGGGVSVRQADAISPSATRGSSTGRISRPTRLALNDKGQPGQYRPQFGGTLRRHFPILATLTGTLGRVAQLVRVSL